MKYLIDDVDKTLTVVMTGQVFELKTLGVSTVRSVYNSNCVGIKIKLKSKYFDDIGDIFK